MVVENIVVIRKLSSYGARPIFFVAFVLTARQYGEVVLPDAASGHDPDTLARKLSRRAPRERREQRGCKEGMAWFLQIQVQVLSKPGVSRYKFDKWNRSVKM
jgi:hypothetical protein